MAVTEKLRFLLEADATGVVRAFDKVGDAADKNLIRAQSRMDKVGAGLSKFGAASIGVGTVVGTALFKAASAFEDLAISAGKFSDATGVAVEDASRWIEVAGDMGIESGALEAGLNKLNKTIGASPEKLAQFGVAVQHAADGTVDVNATFLSLVDRLNEIPDPADRARVASELLGRGWQSMAELIGSGSAALRASLAAVGDAQVVTEDELAKAKEFRASMDELKDSMQSLIITIGQGAAPVIGGLAEGLGSLNRVSGGTVGQVGAIGATALIAGGSVAFLAGKAIQARTAIAAMGTATKVSGGIVAGAAVVYGLYSSAKADAAQRTAELRAAIDLEVAGQKEAAAAALARFAADDQMWQGHKAFTQALAAGVFTLDEWVRALKGESVPAVEDAIAGSAELILRLGYQREAYEDQTAAAKQVAAATKELTGSTDELTPKIDGNARATRQQNEANDKAALALKVKNESTSVAKFREEQLETAIRGVTDALWGRVDAELALDGALDSAEGALSDYNAALGSGDWEAADDALRNAKTALRGVAEAAGEAAAEGKEGSEAQVAAADAQIESLDKVRQTLAVGSPLRQALDEWIAALERVPTSVPTRLSVTGGKDVLRRGDQPYIGAIGGVVTQPTLAVIGEAGPEAVVPLNRAPGASPLPGSVGGVGGVTIMPGAIVIQSAGPNYDGQALIEAIVRAERNMGTGWRT